MRKPTFGMNVTLDGYIAAPGDEITRLEAEDGGPIDIGGATLAAAAMLTRTFSFASSGVAFTDAREK